MRSSVLLSAWLTLIAMMFFPLATYAARSPNADVKCKWLQENFHEYGWQALRKPGIPRDVAAMRDLMRTDYPLQFVLVQMASLIPSPKTLENLKAFSSMLGDPRVVTWAISQTVKNRLETHPMAEPQMVVWLLMDFQFKCTSEN